MAIAMAHMGAELQILEVERKMLAALEKSWADYEEREGQPPAQLLRLMKDLHDCLLKRLTKRIGLTSASVEDLHGMAIELAKESFIVQQMIEQQKRSAGLH